MRLPIELFAPILSHLDPTDLSVLCLVSHSTRIEAERLLYNTVSLTPSPHDIVLFCETLAARPHLKQRIRELELFTASSFAPGYVNLLRNVLQQLPELASVSMTGFGFTSQILSPRCTYRLTKFHWGFNVDRNVVDFLSRQQEITDLALEQSIPSYLHFPATALPKLATLEGDDSVIERLVPGRPVTRIHLLFTGILPNHGTSEVRGVHLPVCHQVGVGFFVPLMERLSSLEVLGVVSCGLIKHEPFLAELTRLERLHTIVAAIHDPRSELRAEDVVSLHTACPSLRTVICIGGGGAVVRWTRSADGKWDSEDNKDSTKSYQKRHPALFSKSREADLALNLARRCIPFNRRMDESFAQKYAF